MTNESGTMRLPIKVVPSSSRDCIAGWLGEALKVRVRAPAERGRANVSVEKLLSDALGVPVRIVKGQASARKTVEIPGISLEQLRQKLREFGNV